jgi:hypothetical protein
MPVLLPVPDSDRGEPLGFPRGCPPVGSVPSSPRSSKGLHVLRLPAEALSVENQVMTAGMGPS